jgi:hypothetical protein
VPAELVENEIDLPEVAQRENHITALVCMMSECDGQYVCAPVKLDDRSHCPQATPGDTRSDVNQ